MARNDFRSDYLAHHGILGQKWGVRRYQNEDGTLTSAGRERYGVKEGGSVSDISSAKGISRRLNDIDKAKARNVKSMTDNLKKAGRKRSIANDNKYSKRVLKAQENIKKGDDEIESLLNKAEELGYDVSSQSTRRLVSSGAEMIAGTLLTSTLATGMLLPFGRVAVVPYAQTVKGTEYKVKNKDNKKTFADKLAEANEKASQRMSINASAEKGLAEYKNKLNSEIVAARTDKELKSVYDKHVRFIGESYEDFKSDIKSGKYGSKAALENKRNSFTDDADKDIWERGVTAKDTKARKEAIKDRVNYAKKTGMYDMEFLERNLDLDPVTEKQMKGEKLDKAYEKFLLEEYEKKHN